MLDDDKLHCFIIVIIFTLYCLYWRIESWLNWFKSPGGFWNSRLRGNKRPCPLVYLAVNDSLIYWLSAYFF